MRSYLHIPLLAFLIFTLLSITSIGMLQQIKIHAEFKISQSLSRARDLSHHAVKTWIKEHEADAQIWANTPQIQQAAKKLLAAPRTQKALIISPTQAELRTWYHPLSSKKNYLGYFIIAPDNISIASKHDQNIGFENLLTKQQEFLQRVWAGKAAVSLPMASDIPLPGDDGNLREDMPTMFVGAPIRGISNQVIAILTLRLNPNRGFTHLLNAGHIGQTGEVYAFDSKGHMISNSRFDEQPHATSLTRSGEQLILDIAPQDSAVGLIQKGDGSSPLPLTYMAKRTSTDETEASKEAYQNYRGVMVLGTWIWYPEYNFGIAIEIDAEEAYQALHSTQYFISILTFFIMLLLLGSTFLTQINHRRKHAEKALTQSYTELEERVIARTFDLKKANTKLQKEIAERKQTEKELQKLSIAVQQSPASIMIADMEGTIEYVNPKFTQITGFSFEEAIGQKPHILNSGHQTTEYYQELWGTIASGKDWSGELLNKKKNGELFWEFASISPIVDKKGEITNFIAVKEDITARKQGEEQVHKLLTQNRSLTQRFFETQEMERRHLARELHDEFGQWLTAIQLHSQVISELAQDKKTSTIYTSARTIHQSAKQMNTVTRSIIRELRPQALDDLGLGEGLRELLNQWQTHHPNTTCELDIQCGLGKLDQCKFEKLDERISITLYRIAQESLTNAAKYADASHLSIQLFCGQQNGRQPKSLILTIEDNGKGMDLLAPSKGMGLTGMRERTLAAKGEFFLNSEPGDGVRIEVRLPIKLGAE